MWATSVCNFHKASQSKQSPKRRKFAQSGHPGDVQEKKDRTRVARWHIFKPKVPVWVNFGGPWNIKVGILCICPFVIYYGHLVDFMAMWYIGGNLVYIFSLVLLYCVEKNLATLLNGFVGQIADLFAKVFLPFIVTTRHDIQIVN
jgi:hypothetical protein